MLISLLLFVVKRWVLGVLVTVVVVVVETFSKVVVQARLVFLLSAPRKKMG